MDIIMQSLEFYFVPKQPLNHKRMRNSLIQGDFEDSLLKKDKLLIKNEWSKLLSKNYKIYSIPKNLAFLYGFHEKNAIFKTTNFRDYIATSRTFHKSVQLNPKAYNLMRVAAVGVAVKSEDNFIIIHKRSKNATHCQGYYDSSVAGLVPIENDKFYFEKKVKECLKRELSILEKDIIRLSISGLHSSRDEGLSGMYTFFAETKLNKTELIDRFSKTFGEKFILMPYKSLKSFIIQKFSEKNNLLCLDGAATLSRCLPLSEFYETTDILTKRGMVIKFGRLEKGKFIEDNSIKP